MNHSENKRYFVKKTWSEGERQNVTCLRKIELTSHFRKQSTCNLKSNTFFQVMNSYRMFRRANIMLHFIE